MQRLIEWSLDNRLLILLLSALVLILGIWSLGQLKLDAIPDLSDTQVIIQANFPGQAPQIIEDQLTYPLTSRMLSVPYAKTVRAYSFFGFALIYIIFEDGTDLYWARSRVLEYLNSMRAKLPKEAELELGPDATSIGWIYEYALTDNSGKLSLADLRDIQDFLLRYELSAIQGVAEVAPIGGFRRQFQVELNPDLLFQYKINLAEVEEAVQKANVELGARLFQQAESEYMLLAQGYLRSVEDMKQIPIRMNSEGGVLRLKDISHIKEGPDMRRGLSDLNGQGEVVGGIIIMRQGADVLETIKKVKEKLEDMKNSLPEGLRIIPAYDRSDLIYAAITNIGHKLLQQMLVVSVIIFIFLGRFRSALLALLVLPFGILISLLILHILGITANIMSLGGLAIAIGVMIDSATVMIENAHQHIIKLQKKHGALHSRHYLQAVKEASCEVAPGLFWAMLIIMISFVPVFALSGQSGRLFIPLALSKTLAMGAAILLALFLLPVLLVYFIRNKKIPLQNENRVSLFLQKYYRLSLAWVLDNKKKALRFGLGFMLLSLIPIFGVPIPFSQKKLLKPLGSEFMPPLEEPEILYMPTTIPGISIAKAKEILIRTDELIMEIPEVKQVFGKIGRAQSATDPAPLSMIESIILLKEKSQWRLGMDRQKLIAELEKKVRLPGLVNAWTTPIRTRIDMLSTGIKTPLGVKITGKDLNKLEELSRALEGYLRELPEIQSAFGERNQGANYIIYELDRYKAGLYGLNASDVHGTISKAIGGMKVADIIAGQKRWSTNIRYLRSYRESIKDLKNVYIPLPHGKGQVPVSEVVKFKIEKGPALIKTENARKSSWLYLDSRETDLGSLAAKVKAKIEELIKTNKIAWEKGYSYVISGQYEQMELVAKRMRLLVPLVILLSFTVLFVYFRKVHFCLWLILSSLLFAPLGGLWLMYLLGYNRSLASDVGFIAMIGLSMETGLIMLVYLDQSFRKLKKRHTLLDLRNSLFQGCLLRLRPIAMTALTDLMALLPLFWGSEPGNVAMRRIAAPMLGGTFTSLVVSLFLIPLLYEWHYAKTKTRE